MMKNNKWLLGIVMGITAMSLMACTSAAPEDGAETAAQETSIEATGDDNAVTDAKESNEDTAPATETKAEDASEAATEDAKADDAGEFDYAKIEGIWMGNSIPGNMWEIKGSDVTIYTPVLDADGMNSNNEFTKAQTAKITSAKKASDETGDYFELSIDNGNTYRWYPDRTDDLECHTEPDGYSASSSLTRQAGSTIADFTISG